MAPVVEVTDVGHASSLLVQLNEQRLRGQFCDVTIIAEDTKFKAHKNVLAASSPYFKEVLLEESGGRQPSHILELPDIQAEVFSDILNFIYNSHLSVPSPAAAKEIGAVGRRLGISRLENLDDPLADAKMDDSGVASSRPCGSPIDLTCPSRSTEPSSPLCFQDLAKAPSPEQDPHPDAETETAKILYNLSSAAAVPAPPPDLAFVLKGSVAWDQNNPSGKPSVATADTETPQAPASPSSSQSGASYPASSTFCCGTCSRSFTTASALSLHVKLHRTRRSLSCRHCGKSFIHIKRLQTHEVLCRGEEKPEELPNPGLPSKPAAMPPSSKKGILFRHRGLPRLDYISDQDHFVKVVDGHIIYFCTVCERSYMTLSSLKRHSNVHSWRRKYPCRYCDKVFALAEYRTKHEVWHTGERRYQCIFCWETFVTYYNLKTHQKAFHGINPGLISSEKTPNGGYKPKLNALKLYRLLPMRSQKRPYKTYSQGLMAENLLLPAQPIPMALGDGDPLDGNLASALGANNVSSVFAPSSSSLDLPEAEHFPRQEPAGAPERSMLPAAAEKAPQDKRPGPPGTEVPPTVIAYGRPASSVIVHSTSVLAQAAPSVITYKSKSSDAPSNTGPLPPQPPPPPSTVAAKPIKKQVLKEYIQSQKAAEQAFAEGGSDQGHRTRGPRVGRTMTYMAKPAYVGAASESRSAPLCQITVRIGEEAIVKRRISETDLMLDKSSRGGGKRFDFGGEKQQPLPALAPHGKHADRGYANESGEEESDRGDAEDQLWRPYYSYKPKRKACGTSGSGNAVPKVKKSRWRRKLRSLRWMKRAEKAEEEEEDEEEVRVGTSDPVSAEMPTGLGGASESEGMDPPPKAGSGRGSDWKHECGVCGKLFSALKKLRKHERVHGRLSKDDQSPALPHRVGRKPLVKFTCARCSKVCKTAAALSRHTKRHEGEQLEDHPPPALPTVIAYSKKAPDLPPAAPSPAVKEETTQEMQVSSSSGEAPAPPQELPEEGPAAPTASRPSSGCTPAPLLEEETAEIKPPFGEEVPLPPPPLEAAPSLADMPPPLSRSLQDPVISHTGLIQKQAPAPQELEEDLYPVQEYPLPLLVPGSCRTRKDLEDKASFLTYPSAIQFNAVGKAGGSEGEGKSDQCFPGLSKEAGALNIGQRWGDPSPTATLSIDLRKVKSTASSFEFRTFDPEGVIFYGDTNPNTDWFVLGLRAGKLEMQIHNNITDISVSGGHPINDGRWHQIMVKNEGDSVVLELDGGGLLTLGQVSHAIIDQPFPEMRIGVGGLLISRKDLLVPMNTAMDGCLRRWNWLNTSSAWLEGAALEGEGTKACFSSIQRGSFFPGGGLAGFMLSGLPTGFRNESWSLAVEVSLRAGPQTGTILAVSPSERAPILSLKLEDTDVVAQLGDKTVLRTPLPMAGCPSSDLRLLVTSAELALRLGALETSQPIQEAEFKMLHRLWLSGEGHLFIGGLPGQGEPPQTVERGFFRGCLHEIRVQGLLLDLDSAHYRSNAIWAHSCPRNESLGLRSADSGAEPGAEGSGSPTLEASPLPS